MKTKVFSLLSLMFLVSGVLFAQLKTQEFKVKGNCGMCEARIEKAAKSVDGVSMADWNKESKVIKVSFDESKSSVQKVQKAIADAGHDTPGHKAKNEVYNALPACCKYDRNEVKMEEDSLKNHKH